MLRRERKNIVQKIVLAGVVACGGKILILQRHKDEKTYPGLWELPSGKREFLESSQQALIREIEEETGLAVEVVAPIAVFDYQIERPEEIRDATQINFLVAPLNRSAEVKLSREHQAFQWITSFDLDNYEMTQETRDVIRKGFAALSIHRS